MANITTRKGEKTGVAQVFFAPVVETTPVQIGQGVSV